MPLHLTLDLFRQFIVQMEVEQTLHLFTLHPLSPHPPRVRSVASGAHASPDRAGTSSRVPTSRSSRRLPEHPTAPHHRGSGSGAAPRAVPQVRAEPPPPSPPGPAPARRRLVSPPPPVPGTPGGAGSAGLDTGCARSRTATPERGYPPGKSQPFQTPSETPPRSPPPHPPHFRADGGNRHRPDLHAFQTAC